MHVRVLAVGLLILGVLFGAPSLVGGATAAPARSPDTLEVAKQQPVSTIPPLPQAPRFSTIPPLPPTATPMRLPATATPVTQPAAPPAAPAAPTPIPPRPTISLPAPASSTPRAGGFPIELALLVFAGSATVLGSGLYLFTRSRSR